jgi:nitrate reductase alpha subunit
MVIIGAAMNHWYHCDMNYRGVINMLMMCGCVGKSGGGWAHYVGQEKLRPQTGWTALAFALDWIRPPRQQNSTSFFYAHTDQWRYEKLGVGEVLSPLADRKEFGGSMIDYNVRAERMGWLPSAPQLKVNPLQVVRDAQAAGMDPKDYTVKGLKDGSLAMSCEDPDAPENWPRNLFVWRSNLLGSSGKGHEYFLKHLLGTSHGVQGRDLGKDDAKPEEVVWHDKAPEGKLDLLVTLDFRMSTTCLYSDIVLPTATWYEKNDLNTSDMHPFIHPLSTAVDPAWQSRSDWGYLQGLCEEIQRGLRRSPWRGERAGADATDARHPRGARSGAGCEGMEEGRDRPHPGQDRAADDGGRARLSERVQTVHRPGSPHGQGGATAARV